MRVLLLSANTGEGHNSTAKAVMEVLEARNVTCDLRDTLEFVSPRFSKFICSCHTRIYNHVGKLFDMGYRAMELSASPDEYTPVYDLLALGAPKLYKLLQTEDYDAIMHELEQYGDLINRPMLVAANKIDLPGSDEIQFLRDRYDSIPSYNGSNIEEIYDAIKDILDTKALA